MSCPSFFFSSSLATISSEEHFSSCCFICHLTRIRSALSNITNLYLQQQLTNFKSLCVIASSKNCTQWHNNQLNAAAKWFHISLPNSILDLNFELCILCQVLLRAFLKFLHSKSSLHHDMNLTSWNSAHHTSVSTSSNIIPLIPHHTCLHIV